MSNSRGWPKGTQCVIMYIIDHHDNTYTVKYMPVQQVASSLDNPLRPHHLCTLLGWSLRVSFMWWAGWLAPRDFAAHSGFTWTEGTAVGGSNVSDHQPPMPWELKGTGQGPAIVP